MADYLDHRQATQLASDLAQHGDSRQSVAQRVAIMERHCKLASRLIRAMLRQTNSSDNWRLPPDDPEA
jgi:hypothetical protein